MKKLAQKLFGPLAAILLVIAPSQYGMSFAGVNITPADLMLPVVFCIAFLAGKIRIKSFPFANTAFLLLVLISCFFSVSVSGSMKECMQCVLYFAIADRIADAAFCHGGEKWIKRAAWLFVIVGACISVLALVQYFSDDPDVFPLMLRPGLAVRGTFGNCNVMGGYLTLLLPFVFGILLFRSKERCLSLRIAVDAALILLVVAGLFVCLSGAALFAIGLVIFAMASLKNKWLGILTAAVLILGFFYVAPETPRDNFSTAIRSVEIYNSDSGEIQYAEGSTVAFEAGEPTRRYPQWQAAVMMSLDAPLTGVGPGMYKGQVGPYYESIPRATGPSEPDIQNLYLVIGSTCGIPALLALIAMLWGPAFAVAGNRNHSQKPSCDTAEGPAFSKTRSPNCISNAASFAVLAFAITAIWHPLLVRGLGIPLVFMLVLSRLKTNN